MGSQNHARAVISCVIDCGNRGANAGIIFYAAVLDGDVEVDTNECAFTFEVEISD